jgi:hypothetical protein
LPTCPAVLRSFVSMISAKESRRCYVNRGYTAERLGTDARLLLRFLLCSQGERQKHG